VKKEPPKPVHIRGTQKGEEMVRKKGREPGRGSSGRGYRSARDSTSLHAERHGPIDPRMPEIPPA